MHTTRLIGAPRLLSVALAASLTLAASCAGTGGEASSGDGWLDGSPSEADARWSGRGGGVSGDDGAAAPVAAEASSSAAASGADVGPSGRGEVAPGLRAGSVDDNEDFAGYLAYLERTAAAGVAARPLDVSVRHVVEVVGSDGRPVLGQPVEVLAGGEVVGVVRTGTDGRAYVHPRAMGVGGGAPVSLLVDGVERPPAQGGPTRVDVDRVGGATSPVPLDLFFVLDATGSMADELDRLTSTVDSVVARIDALDADPDVRLGMTVYRDEGDAFVTRTFDFTDDVAAFRAALGEVGAAGGGDSPEALDEALAAALDEPTWRPAGEAVQVAFVVADAPPQVQRDVPTPYDESLRSAAARGIRIHSVGASGSDDAAEHALRQIAQHTGGRFVFLSYGVGGAALGPSTDIASVDYEELPLEDLLVRLVTEQLTELTGGDVAPVPPSTTIPTTSTTDPQQRQGG